MLISLSVFVNFYLMTVFALSWGTTALGFTREQFLEYELTRIIYLLSNPPKPTIGLWAALPVQGMENYPLAGGQNIPGQKRQVTSDHCSLRLGDTSPKHQRQRSDLFIT